MQTILITGGAGFIGSSLVDKLLMSDNNRVICLDNFNDYYNPDIKEQNIKHNLSRQNYSLYRGDICNNSDLDKIFNENDIDVVVHLAARAGVRPSIENPQLYVETNINGTVSILEQMKKHNLKKMVFASSSSVYGNCDSVPFVETLDINKPISQYAATKIAGEIFCYNYSKLYDINCVCLRFFTVYGPRQRPDLAIRKFIELILRSQEITMFGDGTTMRDYTYIDDIVDGIISAISYDKTKYEIMNLAGSGGNPVTLKNMIFTIEKVLNKKAKIKQLSMQAGDVEKTIGNIEKARELLNYEPKVDFESGIKKFIDWIKTQN
ncbi:MAG: GDP-mannose 4,6-dehydratase [Rickettsiales bacterium]|jgi:UDP-glucuronate 4-epimerase|nr:GDP-mannose 4,6-dehydratase [Rickettsiales bacterium]